MVYTCIVLFKSLHVNCPMHGMDLLIYFRELNLSRPSLDTSFLSASGDLMLKRLTGETTGSFKPQCANRAEYTDHGRTHTHASAGKKKRVHLSVVMVAM